MPVLILYTIAYKQLLQRVRSSTFWKLNYLYLQLYQDRFVVVSVDLFSILTLLLGLTTSSGSI